jgi:aquaporin Z
MREALRSHWPEYVIEATLLALFMLSASTFAVLLEHPVSPLRAQLVDPLLRRALMGTAMGLTAIALIYSRAGKRSGAHMNPAVTLTFLSLGKVARADAAFYVLSHFAGGLAGMFVASRVLGTTLADPSVDFVVTRPGPGGAWIAFVAELAISFVLMSVVLWSASSPRLERFTGVFAGALVATYITLEAPLSGMSMNPARTFGSAVPASTWSAWWVYAVAPLTGMLGAALVRRFVLRAPAAHCAKLHHSNEERCIFCGAHSRTPTP